LENASRRRTQGGEGGEVSDKDFLLWIHARLQAVHMESPNVDYMHKLLDLANKQDAPLVSDKQTTDQLQALQALLEAALVLLGEIVKREAK
jgi:hypothetical protein